ncbi:MAG: hypothetical protein AAGC46_08815 [Solirubrobacteraceae bacterium]|nr:hypothetical protein [Patulibacter sp.]
MSPRSPRTLRRCLPVALLGAAALVLPASAAAKATVATEAAACPDLPTTQAFARYGDTADYALAPGGDFEGSLAGWTLSNAHLAGQNESVGILPGGSHSIALGNSFFASGPSTVTSPWFCVDPNHPYFRYMLKPNGPVGVLATFVRYKNAAGQVIQSQITSKISPNLYTGKWTASQLNPLAVDLSIDGQQPSQVQLVFVSPGSVLGAGYYIDNILVDPYRRG